MSPRHVLFPALLLAAAAGPAAGLLGEGTGGLSLLLPLLAFAAAAAQGLPSALRLAPGTLPSGSPLVRALRGGVALGVAAGFAAGSRHAPFLAALLPAGARALRLPRESRDLRTLRDALLVSVGYLAFEGSGPALLSAAAVTLLAAALLPVIHGGRRPSTGAEEDPAAPDGGAGGLRTALWTVPATALLAAFLFVALPRASDRAGAEPSSLEGRRRRIPDGAGGIPGGGGPGPALVPVRSVRLGDIGRLQRDLRPLLEMAVTRGGKPAHAEDLGPLVRSGALEEFDGTAWTTPDRRAVRLDDGSDGNEDGWIRLPRRRPPAPPAGEAVEQEFLLLAGGSDALFALGIPVAVGGPAAARGILASARGDLRSAESLSEGDVIRVRSVAAAGAYPLLDDEVLPRSRELALLEVPPGHEGTAALAREMLRGAPPGEGTLRALERGLAARCTYSLDLPDAFEGAPVEAFLLVSRRGHCELFASAAAVMLRSAGIPARVAIGFRGGVLDPVSLRYSFRGADAHAWVEAWFEDRGWVTFDPTPAPAGGADREADADPDPAGGSRLGMWLEGILRFDGAARGRLFLEGAATVKRILAAAVLREDGSARRIPVLALLAAAALLAGALLLRARRRRPGPAPAPPEPAAVPPPESYALLLERLAAAGAARTPAETAREHGARVLALGFRPPEAVERVVAAFEEERWGGRPPGDGERRALRELAASVGREPPGVAAPAAPGH